jgi:flagellar assembly factor FliW
MVINSLRFGRVEVPDNKVITLVKPILGFEHLTHYCLVEPEELRPFLCLQSTEDAALTFLVVNPVIFYPQYRIEVNPKEIADLMIKRLGAVETYVIVTVPEDPEKMSVNLQGPVLVNTENNLGRQLILVNSDYRVNHYVMEAVAALGGPARDKVEQVVGV